ncbi:MAG: bifunctional DNA-formamidopyrimidine glycosylase/DNA-(apurinic or apyrimidinic site) lyase [Alphaproteobacteria bacterium]|nr:bifunctional DNA-formamidopyrimidine glycosylase/DNA-(apurinic or apyrimidinic site) lyase [Alphaproteobacteria bacterium]
MPELPEVETVVRGLRSQLVGLTITRVEQRRPDLREKFPARFAGRLQGRRIDSVERRAKYILIGLADANLLVVHLGMTGQFVIGAKPNAIGPHDHVVITLDNDRVLRFNDVRRFGLMDIVPAAQLGSHKRFKGIGPEPLADGFGGAVLEAAFKGRKGPIKAALLDQRNLAGIGNIYASEALYRARISPKRRTGTVTRERAALLATSIREVLEKAVAAGGSSARDYVNADGEQGYFQTEWVVYDREGKPCPSCRAPIKRIVQSGRSTFYCSKCQR